MPPEEVEIREIPQDLNETVVLLPVCLVCGNSNLEDVLKIRVGSCCSSPLSVSRTNQPPLARLFEQRPACCLSEAKLSAFSRAETLIVCSS